MQLKRFGEMAFYAMKEFTSGTGLTSMEDFD